MRNFILALSVLGFFLESAVAEQRTWTIARDVYTADGELVAVRGRTAYLRIGAQVEAIPLERLSAADHAYLDSLELAPIRPGGTFGAAPKNDSGIAGPSFPSSSRGALPAPGEEHSLIVPTTSERELGAPNELASPAVAEEALPLPPGTERSAAGTDAMIRENRARSVGETWPGASQPGAANRRYQLQGQNQQRVNQANANRRDADNKDEPRGFFRARRFERLRGSSR
jgi:hypothetical protein